MILISIRGIAPRILIESRCSLIEEEHMSENIIWVAEATINPGRKADFEAVMKDLVAMTSKEKGALNYQWYITEETGQVYIYERYADIDAAWAHLDTWAKGADRFMDAANFERLIVLSDLPADMRKVLEGINCEYRLPWGGFAK